MIEVPLALAVPWLAAVDTATLVGVPPVMLSVIGLLVESAATVLARHCSQSVPAD